MEIFVRHLKGGKDYFNIEFHFTMAGRMWWNREFTSWLTGGREEHKGRAQVEIEAPKHIPL